MIGVDGQVLSDMDLQDGTDLLIYVQGSDDVEQASVEIVNGKAVDERYNGNVFSSLVPDSFGTIYQIDELLSMKTA